MLEEMVPNDLRVLAKNQDDNASRARKVEDAHEAHLNAHHNRQARTKRKLPCCQILGLSEVLLAIVVQIQR